MTRRRLFASLNVGIAAGLALLVAVTTRPWLVWEPGPFFLGALTAAIALDGLLILVWAQRHALVLGGVRREVAARELLPLVAFSNTANNLTPAASGEVLRAWFLKRNFGMPLSDAAGAITFERLFMFGLLAITALLATLIALDAGLTSLLLVSGVIIVYVALTPWLATPLARWLARRASPAGRFRRLFHGALIASLEVASDRRVVWGTALWSVLAFTLTGLVFWLSGWSAGLSLDPAETWALAGGGTAIGVLSTLPFGLGAAELTAVGIGALLDLEAGRVAATFLVYRIFFTLPLALAGSYSYGRLTLARPPGVE